MIGIGVCAALIFLIAAGMHGLAYGPEAGTRYGELGIDQSIYHVERHEDILVSISGLSEESKRQEITLKLTLPDKTIKYLSTITSRDGKFETKYKLDYSSHPGKYLLSASSDEGRLGQLSFEVWRRASDPAPVPSPIPTPIPEPVTSDDKCPSGTKPSIAGLERYCIPARQQTICPEGDILGKDSDDRPICGYPADYNPGVDEFQNNEVTSSKETDVPLENIKGIEDVDTFWPEQLPPSRLLYILQNFSGVFVLGIIIIIIIIIIRHRRTSNRKTSKFEYKTPYVDQQIQASNSPALGHYEHSPPEKTQDIQPTHPPHLHSRKPLTSSVAPLKNPRRKVSESYITREEALKHAFANPKSPYVESKKEQVKMTKNKHVKSGNSTKEHKSNTRNKSKKASKVESSKPVIQYDKYGFDPTMVHKNGFDLKEIQKFIILDTNMCIKYCTENDNTNKHVKAYLDDMKKQNDEILIIPRPVRSEFKNFAEKKPNEKELMDEFSKLCSYQDEHRCFKALELILDSKAHETMDEVREMYESIDQNDSEPMLSIKESWFEIKTRYNKPNSPTSVKDVAKIPGSKDGKILAYAHAINLKIKMHNRVKIFTLDADLFKFEDVINDELDIEIYAFSKLDEYE